VVHWTDQTVPPGIQTTQTLFESLFYGRPLLQLVSGCIQIANLLLKSILILLTDPILHRFEEVVSYS
jgi:hypothetical protein